MFCAISLIGVVGLALNALRMALDRRAAKTLRTVWLVELKWIGLLILLAAAPIAYVVALWREAHEWRKLERKYEGKDSVR